MAGRAPPAATLPNRIAELRMAQGLSQPQLAKRANTTAATIGKLETESMQLTVSWMRRIARALGVTAADLLSDADVPYRLTNDELDLLGLYRRLNPHDKTRLRRLAEAFVDSAGPLGEAPLPI